MAHDDDHDLYARVTRIRADAFELIDALAGAADADEPDPLRTLALVRMQAVANSLGRIQGDLGAELVEEGHLRPEAHPCSAPIDT